MHKQWILLVFYKLLTFQLFPFLIFFFKVVSSPEDVAEKADRIITVLPTSINAIEAYSGANGILKYVFPNCGYFLVMIVHEFLIC